MGHIRGSLVQEISSSGCDCPERKLAPFAPSSIVRVGIPSLEGATLRQEGTTLKEA